MPSPCIGLMTHSSAGLPLIFVLALLAPAEQLAGALQQLPLPLAYLDRVDGVVGSDLLDRLAATDRLHGDPGLELGPVGAALAHRWEPPFRGGAPPQRLTMGAVQKNQTTSEASPRLRLHEYFSRGWPGFPRVSPGKPLTVLRILKNAIPSNNRHA